MKELVKQNEMTNKKKKNSRRENWCRNAKREKEREPHCNNQQG